MKTLYLDIETAPNVAHVWALWKQDINLALLRESSRMLCFAAKWGSEPSKALFFSEADGRGVMLDAAHELLSEADVVCTYNGRSFDIPTIQKELLLGHYPPPAPFDQLDLYRVIRKQFRFPSYKLAYISETLGVGRKLKHEGHEMWIRAMAGDPTAFEQMAKYCIRDTLLLPRIHQRILPWIGSAHPNRALFAGEELACPYCGSERLTMQGYRNTKQGMYQRFKCRKCCGWSGSGKRVSHTDTRPI